MVIIREYLGDFLSEFDLQKYIFEHAEKFGFSSIRYARRLGCDFVAKFNEKLVKIEVEMEYSGYFRHANDPRFKDVKVLVCLEGAYPNQETSKSLPERIIYVKSKDFSAWAKKIGKNGEVRISEVDEEQGKA